MNLNPITALSDQLQKLINERGSSAILRDHLALFKDQVTLLEKKAMTLEAENAELKSKVNQLTEDNKKMGNKIHEHEHVTKELTHNNLLDENKIKILQCLWNHPQGLTEDQIAHILSLDIQAAKYHIEELEKQNMIDAHWRLPRIWKLIQEGRGYLIENKLIS